MQEQEHQRPPQCGSTLAHPLKDELTCKPCKQPTSVNSSTSISTIEIDNTPRTRPFRLKKLVNKRKFDTLYRRRLDNMPGYAKVIHPSSTGTTTEDIDIDGNITPSSNSNVPIRILESSTVSNSNSECSISNSSSASVSSSDQIQGQAQAQSQSQAQQEFVKGRIPYFWECTGCRDLPISARAKHSVLFASESPTNASGSRPNPTMQNHFQMCAQVSSEARQRGVQVIDEEGSSDEDEVSVAMLPKTTRATRRRGRPRKDVQGDADQNAKARGCDDDDDAVVKKTKKRRKKAQRKPQVPPDSPSTLKSKLIAVRIPSTENGLIDSKNDKSITGTIDILLLTQVERCEYVPSEDTISHLRQKPLPEGFPGIKCKHCDEKKWFFNSPTQLATGLPKIEQHLMLQCSECPETMKSDISTAKSQEDAERFVLRAESGDKVTRRQYAGHVFERLGAYNLK